MDLRHVDYLFSHVDKVHEGDNPKWKQSHPHEVWYHISSKQFSYFDGMPKWTEFQRWHGLWEDESCMWAVSRWRVTSGQLPHALLCLASSVSLLAETTDLSWVLYLTSGSQIPDPFSEALWNRKSPCFTNTLSKRFYSSAPMYLWVAALATERKPLWSEVSQCSQTPISLKGPIASDSSGKGICPRRTL